MYAEVNHRAQHSTQVHFTVKPETILRRPKAETVQIKRNLHFTLESSAAIKQIKTGSEIQTQEEIQSNRDKKKNEVNIDTN